MFGMFGDGKLAAYCLGDSLYPIRRFADIDINKLSWSENVDLQNGALALLRELFGDRKNYPEFDRVCVVWLVLINQALADTTHSLHGRVGDLISGFDLFLKIELGRLALPHEIEKYVRGSQTTLGDVQVKALQNTVGTRGKAAMPVTNFDALGEDLFEQVASELDAGQKSAGLWLKAELMCDGEPTATRLKYIELRLSALEDERLEREQLKAEQRKAEQRKAEQRKAEQRKAEQQKLEQRKVEQLKAEADAEEARTIAYNDLSARASRFDLSLRETGTSQWFLYSASGAIHELHGRDRLLSALDMLDQIVDAGFWVILVKSDKWEARNPKHVEKAMRVVSARTITELAEKIGISDVIDVSDEGDE